MPDPSHPHNPTLLPASAPTNQGGSSLLPRTGTVLIGTPATLRTIGALLRALPLPVIPVGCVLLSRLTGGRDTTIDGHEHTTDDTPGAAGAAQPLPPLLGFLDDLIALHARHRFRAAVVCVPLTDERCLSRLVAILERLDIPTRVVPSAEQLLAPPPSPPPAPAAPLLPEATRLARAAAVHQRRTPPPQAVTAVLPRAFDPAALIGRSPHGVNRQQLTDALAGRTVLITGAGGSIGSELARVCGQFGPSTIVLMERAENALFQIDAEIARLFPGVRRRSVLHDVVDHEQTLRLMLDLRPHVVFHAAAHKHVPLMEDHPAHALSNNLFGTKAVVDAAIACGAERMVMISSDKAVNPTSVMGATKRLAEIYVAAAARTGLKTRLSMVRFGNVLASACSVVPIWTRQLAAGEPITVTDPRMTRYFMTIPEAAALVAQAGALPQDPADAPVYVLDMGQPIAILDLARRFARLHGFRPRLSRLEGTAALPPLAVDPEDHADDADLPEAQIVLTGARPGEKLYEELAYAAELLAPTSHPGINRWTPPQPDSAAATAMVAELSALRSPAADKAAVIAAIARHVPEMQRR